MTKKLLISAFAGLLLLAGCSSNESSQPTSGPAVDEAAQPPAAAPDQPGQKRESGQGRDSVDPGVGPVAGRSLIYRGDVTVRVDNVEAAADQIAAIATTAGGFVGSEKRDTGGRDSTASVTVRVPSKQFHDVIARISKLGVEQSRSTNTEDVTEAVLDLELRIQAAQESVKRIQALYAQSKSVSELANMERELRQRLEELSVLQARKRQLDDLVALSTLTVTLVGPNTVFEVPKEPDPSFLGGLSEGWHAFVSAFQLASAIFGFLLPFLVTLAIPVLVTLWLVQRRRRDA